MAQMTGDTVHLIDNPGSLMARMQLVSMNSPEIVCRKTAFAGTGFAEQYLAEVGLLPKGSTLDELDPLRNINLHYTVDHAEKVAASLEQLSLEIRHILYNVRHQNKPLDKEVDQAALLAWEADSQVGTHMHEQMKSAVHDHLMARLARHWDVETGPADHEDVAATYKILQRNARDSHPIRVVPVAPGKGGESSKSAGVQLHVPDRNFILSMVGESRKGTGLLKEGKGINFTASVIDKVRRDTLAIGAKLAGQVNVVKSDGFAFWSEAQFGESVYGDPPYLPMLSRKKPQDGMNYLAGQREEYLYENWEKDLLEQIG